MDDAAQARAHLDEAAKAISELDGMLAYWFAALGSQRQQLAKVLGHVADASAALADGVGTPEGSQR